MQVNSNLPRQAQKGHRNARERREDPRPRNFPRIAWPWRGRRQLITTNLASLVLDIVPDILQSRHLVTSSDVLNSLHCRKTFG